MAGLKAMLGRSKNRHSNHVDGDVTPRQDGGPSPTLGPAVEHEKGREGERVRLLRAYIFVMMAIVSIGGFIFGRSTALECTSIYF